MRPAEKDPFSGRWMLVSHPFSARDARSQELDS
jgi:hypothetical protein